MKIEKWIDTTNLPKKNGKIDWEESIGYELSFKYGETKGIIKILDRFENRKLLIQYNNKTKEILPGKLLLVQLADLVGYKNYDYIYNTNQIINDINGNEYQILNRYVANTSKKHRRYLIKCLSCNCDFERAENEIKNSHCPYCMNKTHIYMQNGFNDIATTHPELAKLLYYEEDSYNYTINTDKKLFFKCGLCGEKHNIPIKPLLVLKQNLRVPCEYCGEGFSYPNKFMANLLNILNVEYKPEKVFSWSDGKRYDFYIEKYKTIIEMHGSQHYNDNHFGDYEQIKMNDKYKMDMAINNGIINYICIDCSSLNPKDIFNNILDSKLNDLFDLSNINIKEIDTLCNELIKNKVKELYELGLTVNDISNKLKISTSTTYKYLHILEDLNIINIDWDNNNKIGRQKIIDKTKQRDSNPVLCIDKNIAFNSMANTARLSEDVINIKVCSSELCKKLKEDGFYKELKWKRISKEEFNKHKQEFPELTFGDSFLL